MKDMLHRHGLKVTDSRIAVLKVLMNTDAALSHAEITERLGDQDIDKVTLYRTLNAFTERGLAHKVATDDRNWLYALHLSDRTNMNPDSRHAHFICNTCEKIYCYPQEESPLDVNKADERGFVVQTKEVRLHGLCPDCRQHAP